MLNTHRVHHAMLNLHSDAQRERVRQALPLALQQALDAAAPPDTLWLLRRLPCRLSLAEDASLDDTVQLLQQSLQAALRRTGAMADDGGLLRFQQPCEALNDAFADALVGRRDRAWAWARLGLWPAADTPRAEATRLLNSLLPALDRQPLLPTVSAQDPAPPHRRRALLAALLSRGLLSRALALLTPAQWAQLAAGLPGAAVLPALAGAEPHAAAGQPAETHTESRPMPWPDGADAAACLAALHSTPLPAARRAAAAQWLAWLAWLHSDAIGLAAAPTAQVQRRLQGMAQSALRGAARPAARSAPGAAAAAARGPRQATAPVPQETPAAKVWRTAHGGLLHLLPLLPRALSGADGLAGSAGLSRERLLRLAVQGLGLPLDDPALAVWLGATAPSALQAPAPDAQAATDRAALVAAVQSVLQRHLPASQRADIGSDPLPWLLQRGATLHHEPGRWLAVFDEADTRLRRSGLDRDPGHLPWLGMTVALRYE